MPSNLPHLSMTRSAGCVRYTPYGVATELQHTEQLVRDIESQAVAQAKGAQRSLIGNASPRPFAPTERR